MKDYEVVIGLEVHVELASTHLVYFRGVFKDKPPRPTVQYWRQPSL